MHDKFTERVRKVMYLAREEAALDHLPELCVARNRPVDRLSVVE